MARLTGWLRRTGASMSARARRHYALEDARYDLDLWRDHGDPARLEAAIQRLREADRG